jgi:hypothetical protein
VSASLEFSQFTPLNVIVILFWFFKVCFGFWFDVLTPGSSEDDGVDEAPKGKASQSSKKKRKSAAAGSDEELGGSDADDFKPSKAKVGDGHQGVVGQERERERGRRGFEASCRWVSRKHAFCCLPASDRTLLSKCISPVRLLKLQHRPRARQPSLARAQPAPLPARPQRQNRRTSPPPRKRTPL